MDVNESMSPSIKNGTPILSSFEKAMAGDRPPIKDQEPVIPSGTTGSWESQGSSQNDIDLNKYQKSMSRTKEEVLQNWKEEGKDTPSVITATAIDNNTTPAERDPYKEKENEQLRKSLEETNRRVTELEETVKRLKELTQKYDDPDKLQNALDPKRERPVSPIEEVRNVLREQESERQKKFADAVEAERVAHDPLYNKDNKNETLSDDAKRRERKLKTLAIIGGVGGFAAAVVGGSAISGPVLGGAALLSVGLGAAEKVFFPKRINTIMEKINNAKTDEEKVKLEKSLKTWNKIRDIAVHTLALSTGAGIGTIIGGLVSGLAFGGRGISEVINANRQTGAAGITEASHRNVMSEVSASQPATPTPTPEVAPAPVETFDGLGDYFDTGLTQQQYSSLGWRGSRIILNPTEASIAPAQNEFFSTMAKILGGPEKIKGYEAALKYNPFFRAIYNGTMTPVEAGTRAAAAILGN